MRFLQLVINVKDGQTMKIKKNEHEGIILSPSPSPSPSLSLRNNTHTQAMLFLLVYNDHSSSTYIYLET